MVPHVLTARDGRNHTVADERDLLQLVSEYLGPDFSDWLEEIYADQEAELRDEITEIKEAAKETETELDSLKNHQRQVFTEVYEAAEHLMELSDEEHPDITEINRLAEKIWDVMGNEL